MSDSNDYPVNDPNQPDEWVDCGGLKFRRPGYRNHDDDREMKRPRLWARAKRVFRNEALITDSMVEIEKLTGPYCVRTAMGAALWHFTQLDAEQRGKIIMAFVGEYVPERRRQQREAKERAEFETIMRGVMGADWTDGADGHAAA